MKPDSIIKSIVRAVKSKEELGSVVCVYSDSRETAQNPICSFTLCMGLGRIKYSKDFDTNRPGFLTAIKLSLLAPSGAGGKRLTEVAMWITEAIRESLSVSLIEVTEPRYIDTSSTLYADITVTIEDESLAEDSACEIYADEVLAEEIISYCVESTENYERQPELLKGYTLTNNGEKEYCIKIKSRKPLKIGDVFTLKFYFDGYREVYENCRVKKLNRELSKWGNLSYSYEITAESTEVQSE